jgi:hypothetical protein
MEHRVWRFTLPLPITQNQKKSILWKNKRKYARLAREAKVATYLRARSTGPPPKKTEIPDFVHVEARFYVHNLRDKDKLGASLEWTLDALKGLWFVDDSPRHMELTIYQRVERTNKRLELVITEVLR